MKDRFEFSLQYPKPLSKEDLAPLMAVAQSGNFSRYTSEVVINLEKKLAHYYQTEHAITCTSGTAALHGCLVALDFAPGSEVIMTSIADIGIVLPVIYENLVPVFADVDFDTFNVGVEQVASCITKKTKAVIAVHLAGSPCDLTGLRALCDKHGLILLEDFSQAHGAKWQDKKIGSYGDMAYGSFQQSKQITCGEGGVILTNDATLARRAFIGVDKAWQRDKSLDQRSYEFLAPNLRFNALQAAVLEPQISRLDQLVAAKRQRAEILYNKVEALSDVIIPQRVLPGAYHAFYSFPLITKNQAMRDQLVKLLDDEYNVQCAYGYANPKPLYQCVNALKDPARYGKELHYSTRKYPIGTCPNAEKLLTQSFLLPFNENFTLAETEEMADRLGDACKKMMTMNEGVTV